MAQLREPPLRTNLATDALVEAWEALKRHLQFRREALAEEVRHYPTPIARCDEQLGKLLEQRAHTLNQLRRMLEHDSKDHSYRELPSVSFLRQFVESYDPSDDEEEMAVVDRLRAALTALQGSE